MTTGADLLVGKLIQRGIDTLLTVPGIHLYAIFEALARRPGAIHVISARHEQGAGYMGVGYSQASGAPCAVAVLPGIGLLNVSGAISTAYACNAPVLFLIGSLSDSDKQHQLGATHELKNQTKIIKSLTKWCARPGAVEDIPASVDKALDVALQGRRGPTAIELPRNLMEEVGSFGEQTGLTRKRRGQLPNSTFEAAIRLSAAHFPIIVAGGGAQNAARPIWRLSTLIGAPVISNVAGKGIMDDRSDLSVPRAASKQLWEQADVILAIGTRLRAPQLRWGLRPDQCLIRIDIDHSQLLRIAPPTIAICADSAEAAESIASMTHPANPTQLAERSQIVAQVKSSFYQFADQQLHFHLSYLRAIRSCVPDDTIFVDENTQMGYAARVCYPAYAPRTFLSYGFQGALGYGFPAALGAKLAYPDRTVISINGDGGFLFCSSELSTAVKYKLGIIILVFNDGAYGNVHRHRQRWKSAAHGISDLYNPDFVELAKSFGAIGARAHSPESLVEIIRSRLGSPIPTVIEIKIGELPDPWPILNP
jgi:acetolactate synthase I/II/III large subunit